MFGWLRKAVGRSRPTKARRSRYRQASNSYDAAQTNQSNSRHWAWADSLSAKSANSLEVRKTLRERARYEFANNSYCQGIVLTRANDVVGTGPRLQCQTESQPANRQIETAFAEWMRAVRLADDLRTMCVCKSIDGEPFGILRQNDMLSTSVKLAMALTECDQVTTPDLFMMDAQAVDGIVFDKFGNPVEYHVLKDHPGDSFLSMDYQRIPARFMLHWFRKDRPGQARGIPEITAALPLFAQLRRFTLATLTAAEVAADFAAVLESEATANETDYNAGEGGADDEEESEDFKPLEIIRGMMTQLPSGMKLNQFDPRQPATTYQMFKRELLSEIARCLSMPYAVAAGDSSDHNYASGRLDFQTWDMAIRVERSQCEAIVLERLFAAWLDEATKIHGLLPPNLSALAGNIPHRWFWDSRPHVDPQKNANALQVLLDKNATTLADHYAADGKDWEDALRQRAKERALEKELGLEPVAAPQNQPNQPKDETDDEQEVEEEREPAGAR